MLLGLRFARGPIACAFLLVASRFSGTLYLRDSYHFIAEHGQDEIRLAVIAL